MPEWNDKIIMTDSNWQRIELSSKTPESVNVRYAPVVSSGNVAGRIFADTVKGLVNLKYAYKSGVYVWFPVQLEGTGFEGQPYLWVVSDLVNYTLGEFVQGAALYYDLALPGQPTIRIAPEQLNIVVEVLHAVANYLASMEGEL